jgi:hypothetical protein
LVPVTGSIESLFASVEPSAAALVRAAFDLFDPGLLRQ